eukprot:1160877-Pelagomonas_calceolata.AAC.4
MKPVDAHDQGRESTHAPACQSRGTHSLVMIYFAVGQVGTVQANDEGLHHAKCSKSAGCLSHQFGNSFAILHLC